jgi:toxin ParE1/3/4
VRLRGFRLSKAADRQVTQIFQDSETRFGSDARARYEALIARAIRDLVEDQERLGTKVIKGNIHYHLRHSRGRVAGRVGNPRHLIVARIIGDRLQVLTVVYDAMVEGLKTGIEEGEES